MINHTRYGILKIVLLRPLDTLYLKGVTDNMPAKNMTGLKAINTVFEANLFEMISVHLFKIRLCILFYQSDLKQVLNCSSLKHIRNLHLDNRYT